MPANSNSFNESKSSQDELQFSLYEILCFLKSAWKTILTTGFVGLLFAVIFLAIVPNQYEAVANIVMTRIPSDKIPLGSNLEEPQALINRMSIPTGMGAKVLQACGLQESNNSPMPSLAQVGKVFRYSIPKGVPNIVEFKVNQPSVKAAKVCANSVFEEIVSSQKQMIDSMFQAAKSANSSRLVKVQERLAQDRDLLVKAGETKNTVSPTYFVVLSEIRALEDERDNLLAAINIGAVQTATLQSSIFVADEPVYPKKTLSVMAGLVGGVFLGLLIAWVRQIFLKPKMQMSGAVR